MQQYEFSGKVIAVGQTQSFGQKGFQKREFVVEEGRSKYPCPVQFSLKKNMVGIGDSLAPGMAVTVKFKIEGRKWDGNGTTRYFVDLVATEVNTSHSNNVNVPAPAVAPSMPSIPDSGDDRLPF